MSEQVRVAHLGPDPGRPGGMAAVLGGMLESPLATTYRLDVIPTYGGPGRIHRLAVFARALVNLIRWSWGGGRRIVHVHTAVRGSIYRKAVCVAVAKLARCPVVLHFHAGPGDIDDFAAGTGWLRLRLLRAATRSADRVLSVSSASARRVEAVFGAPEVIVVPNAAPRVHLDGRARDGVDGRFVALYMGGFADPAKGGDMLVAALPELTGALPDAQIVLAGPGAPPATLAQIVAERPAVSWVGWLDEDAKRRALTGCGVFVLPSISEGLPVALLEAMAYGLAIVASDVGGIPDVLVDGADALLVPPGDPEALAAAIAAVAQGPDLRTRLGRAASRRAARLSRDEVAGRVDAIYRELIG